MPFRGVLLAVKSTLEQSIILHRLLTRTEDPTHLEGAASIGIATNYSQTYISNHSLSLDSCLSGLICKIPSSRSFVPGYVILKTTARQLLHYTCIWRRLINLVLFAIYAQIPNPAQRFGNMTQTDGAGISFLNTQNNPVWLSFSNKPRTKKRRRVSQSCSSSSKV